MSDRDSTKDLLISFVGLLLFAGVLAGGAYLLGSFCMGLLEAHEETHRAYSMRRRSSSGSLVVLSGVGAGLCALGAVGALIVGARYYGAALFKRTKEP
jgi:hypothetical protein